MWMAHALGVRSWASSGPEMAKTPACSWSRESPWLTTNEEVLVTMPRHVIAVFALALAFDAGSAQAALTINIVEVGPDVVMTGSGSLDLTDLTLLLKAQTVAFINPD